MISQWGENDDYRGPSENVLLSYLNVVIMNPYKNFSNLDEFLADISGVLQLNKEADMDAEASVPRSGPRLREYITSLVPAWKRTRMTENVDDAINMTLRASHWALIQET